MGSSWNTSKYSKDISAIMKSRNDSGQGDIIGFIIEIICAAILIWLFFIVILPTLLKTVPGH
jgi:hypothetical protein